MKYMTQPQKELNDYLHNIEIDRPVKKGRHTEFIKQTSIIYKEYIQAKQQKRTDWRLMQQIETPYFIKMLQKPAVDIIKQSASGKPKAYMS